MSETNVRFLCGFCGDLCLVNYAFHVTASIHGAYVRFPTVAAFPSSIISACEFPDFRFVVVTYNSFNAAHAAVAQFKGVPVENFVKRISFAQPQVTHGLVVCAGDSVIVAVTGLNKDR